MLGDSHKVVFFFESTPGQYETSPDCLMSIVKVYEAVTSCDGFTLNSFHAYVCVETNRVKLLQQK